MPPDIEETPDASEEEQVSIHIPRELFFTGNLPEEAFLAWINNFGGTVAPLAEDADTFWQRYGENSRAVWFNYRDDMDVFQEKYAEIVGTAYIHAKFPESDFITLGLEIAEYTQQRLTALIQLFDSISELKTETTEAYTRFVFVVDFDAFVEDHRIIELLDFVFPYCGQLEYLRRIFALYDMAMLEKIVFYIENAETLERTEIYSFLLDAPFGLAIRHGVRFN